MNTISWVNEANSFHMIDIRAGSPVVFSMRRIVPIALATFLSAVSALAQTTNPGGPPKLVKTPTSLPTPKAEPENANAYAAPAAREHQGPTEEDVGPVLKHFVRASDTDDLESTQRADNASLEVQEKVALDKRITIPLIHDVQNDGPGGKQSGNHAMAYEITYLNWGAVTQEQLLARQGHYFTITWANDGPKSDFTTRFEYRQIKSKEIVRTLTEPPRQVSGAVRSYFAVVNKAYLAYGPIVSWRFTILRGDTIVGEAKSFIW
jgi:hypothetical protein